MIRVQNLTSHQMGSLAALGPGSVLEIVFLFKFMTEVMPSLSSVQFPIPLFTQRVRSDAYLCVQFRKRANRPVLSLANAL